MTADELRAMIGELREIEVASRRKVSAGGRSDHEHLGIMSRVAEMRNRILTYVTNAPREDVKVYLEADLVRIREAGRPDRSRTA